MGLNHLKPGVYIYIYSLYTPALGPIKWTVNIEVGLNQEYIYMVDSHESDAFGHYSENVYFLNI